MGKAVENVAAQQGITVGKIISSDKNTEGDGIRQLKKNEVDVLLDFSVPAAVISNIYAAAESGIQLVVGTTGWYDQLEKARSVVEKYKIGMFYASNFSIGMNIMYELVQRTVRFVNGFPEYDIYIQEIHHNQKEDSPSGSAYKLADIIVKESARKKRIETERVDGKIDNETLHVSSTRAGSTVASHLVGFDSDFDSIEIKHTAKNRTGYVQGALRAAFWIKGKTGVYTMEDLLHV